MITDTDIVKEEVGLDNSSSANLGTILIIEDDPRMQKVLREESLLRSIMPSSLLVTVRRGSSCSVANARSPWFSI